MTGNRIRCTGRALDDQGQPVGDPCGRQFVMPAADLRPIVVAARNARWSIGPNGEATCPACRRPDPTLAALCRELARSVRR